MKLLGKPRVKIDYENEKIQAKDLKLSESGKILNEFHIRTIPIDADVSEESDEIKEAIQKIKDKKEK